MTISATHAEPMWIPFHMTEFRRTERASFSMYVLTSQAQATNNAQVNIGFHGLSKKTGVASDKIPAVIIRCPSISSSVLPVWG